MEKNNDLALYRYRNIGTSVVDGYRLFINTFRTTFRATWTVALGYALALGVLMTYYFHWLLPAIVASHQVNLAMGELVLRPSTGTIITGALLFLLYVVAICAFASQGFALLKSHRQTGALPASAHWYGRFSLPMMGRMAVTMGWLLLLTVAVGALMGGLAWLIGTMNQGELITSIVLLALVGVAIVVACLPLTYTIMRSMLANDFKPQPPVQGYRAGFRHLGSLFAVLLVAQVMTLLASAVSQLPAFVLAIANQKALADAALGNPLALPDGIMAMNFATFTIAGFIQAYLHLSAIFPLYYAYGSIEVVEGERRKTEITTTP